MAVGTVHALLVQKVEGLRGEDGIDVVVLLTSQDLASLALCLAKERAVEESGG